MRRNSHSIRERLSDRLFDSGGVTHKTGTVGSARNPRQGTPTANVRNHKDLYELEFVVPGYKQDELSIQIQNQLLTITGKRHRKLLQDGEGLIRYEHDLKSFTRTFELDEDMDPKKVTATYEAGILHLTIKSKHGRISMAPAPIRVPIQRLDALLSDEDKG